MQSNRLAALALAAALCLGTAACGSSDGDDAAATTTTRPATTTTTDETGDPYAGMSPEQATFLRAADKICKDSTDRLNEATAEIKGDSLDVAAYEAFLKMAAEESNKQIAAVRELEFPEADADELDAAFTAFEAAFAKVAADPANTIEHTSTPEFQEATAFMDEYGFAQCGEGGERGG